jgi:transcriptional regulator with XRE-family HTH domain
MAPADLVAAVRDGVGTERRAAALGAIIERERLARGLSVGELAAEAAVAPSTLARWAAGRHRPTPAALRRLARALDLDAESLGRAAGGTP